MSLNEFLEEMEANSGMPPDEGIDLDPSDLGEEGEESDVFDDEDEEELPDEDEDGEEFPDEKEEFDTPIYPL